jgi:Family of unknown function (DUF6184)
MVMTEDKGEASKTTGSGARRIVLAALISAGSLVVGRGCGDVTDSRVAARDAATQHTCARYQACGDIGAGLTYSDLSACTTQWQANWDNSWPAADCQGKIDQSQLSFCLAAIDGTSCTNGLDILDTILVKCAKATVCDQGNPPPVDAGTD